MSAKTFDDWLVEIGLEKTAEAKGIEKGRKEGIEKGIEKGRKEGIKKGIEKGRKEGIEKLSSLLENGYSLKEAKEILKQKAVSA